MIVSATLYTYSFYLSTSDFLSFIISNTDKHEFSCIWKWIISCCNDVMNHVDCVIKRDVYQQNMHSCSKNIRGLSFFVLKISVMGGSRGGGDRGSGPPPWNFGKNVLIGFVKWYWFDIAQHLCKIQSYIKKKVLKVETSSWLELETLTFLVKGLHPLKSGNQSII